MGEISSQHCGEIASRWHLRRLWCVAGSLAEPWRSATSFSSRPDVHGQAGTQRVYSAPRTPLFFFLLKVENFYPNRHMLKVEFYVMVIHLSWNQNFILSIIYNIYITFCLVCFHAVKGCSNVVSGLTNFDQLYCLFLHKAPICEVHGVHGSWDSVCVSERANMFLSVWVTCLPPLHH